jgi:hypothetical protein
MFLGITPLSSVSNGLCFLTLPLVSAMRVIYTSKGLLKKFGVRVIYRKIQYVQCGAANRTVCGLLPEGDRILASQEILSIWHCLEPHQSNSHAHVLIYTWMHMWSATYIVHDSSTYNAFTSAVQPSRFNIKVSEITPKLYCIVCHQHPFYSKELPFYLIWIQKDFMFGFFFFRYQQFMKMFQAVEMEIVQGWVHLIYRYI